ncbi:MAG: hypothetical protein J5647_04560 [Spirochaetaceae bacterium]|nr:hypothetical protein [Spirochaetaceae bacterium]
MKKLLLLIIAILICGYAFTETNVNDMSNDELKSLYKSVKQELINRKLWDKSTLPAGVYISGESLPEGSYECIVLYDYTGILSYKTYDDFANNKSYVSIYQLNEGDVFLLTLKGNMCWDIRKPVIVRPFVGMDW